MMSTSAMGIIFPNLHDENLPELVAHRTMASLPFAGRYRMIDFCLSGMANAGMRDIGVIVRKNYQSLMDHLGSGREWDLSRKRGGLVIFPPYGRDGEKVYQGRIEGLSSVMVYLQARWESLVVMSDCNVACNIDYKDLIRSHAESGADVTAVYEKISIPDALQKDNVCFSITDDNQIHEVRVNEYRKGPQNVSMNIYVVGREFLINVVKDAMMRGDTRFEQDVLSRGLKIMKVHAYECTGYRARIYNIRSYFEENLRLLNKHNLEQLFPEERPIYTKVRDEAPVRYAMGSHVTDSMVADGCIIEGDLKNCVIFRGVRVGKGARLKNCVVMQGSEIAANVEMENVVTDKNVFVSEGQQLRGANNFPVFIAKNYRVGGED